MKIEAVIENDVVSVKLTTEPTYRYGPVKLPDLSADEAEDIAASLLAAVACHRDMARRLRQSARAVVSLAADVAADAELPANARVVEADHV